MKLLIGTINALVLWDGKKQHVLQEGNYYGITWDEQYIYASRNPPHENVSIIDVFTKKFDRINELFLPIELSAVHQILVVNNKLHICYTNMDRIVVYDLAKRKTQSFNWTGEKKDTCHLNSIWWDGKWCWVVESGKDINNKAGIRILDKDFRPIAKVAFDDNSLHLHNVYIEFKTIYSCGNYGILRGWETVDLRRDKELGFLRGLARTPFHWWIGESERLPRAERINCEAKILCLNNNFQMENIINLENTGQIQEIRAIGDFDWAHSGMAF